MQEGAPGCGGRTAPDPFPGSQPASIADIYGFIIREHHFLSPQFSGTGTFLPISRVFEGFYPPKHLQTFFFLSIACPLTAFDTRNSFEIVLKCLAKCIERSSGCSSTGNTRWVLQTAHIPIYCALPIFNHYIYN